MEIKFYNSLTNKIEPLKPLIPGEVSMYVCGSTVYDHPHVGNLRPVVVFDVVRRLLTYVGYKVTFVTNYTDVDDKIIAKALKEGKPEIEIANRYIKEIEEITAKVHSLKPSYTPRVTEYMDKIIAYIAKLVEVGAAYERNGDVYFRVESVPNYGELSNMQIEDLKVGARIDENDQKESPLDFALWKKTDVGIKWDSPWGLGRPGWHTECCVMIDSIFPAGIIDIHGGGFDLKFPHHENEIAQNKASNHNHLANMWMHNGFVTFGDEKMSKSLGNVVTSIDALDKFGGNVVRLTLLSSHYRAPVSFLDETINMAKAELERISKVYDQLAVKLQLLNVDINNIQEKDVDAFVEALADDLNVSNALSVMFETIKLANNELRQRDVNIDKLKLYFNSLKTMLDILGLDIDFPCLSEDDKAVYNKYLEYKANKDFANSDILRAELIKRRII